MRFKPQHETKRTREITQPGLARTFGFGQARSMIEARIFFAVSVPAWLVPRERGSVIGGFEAWRHVALEAGRPQLPRAGGETDRQLREQPPKHNSLLKIRPRRRSTADRPRKDATIRPSLPKTIERGTDRTRRLTQRSVRQESGSPRKRNRRSETTPSARSDARTPRRTSARKTGDPGHGRGASWLVSWGRARGAQVAGQLGQCARFGSTRGLFADRGGRPA